MNIVLTEEDVIENLDDAVECVKQRAQMSRAKKQSELVNLRSILNEQFPEKFSKLRDENTPISVADHRKALRSALKRQFTNMIEHGLEAFVITFDTDPRDCKGDPEDESGSCLARAHYCRAVLQTQGVLQCEVYDKETYALLVVVI